ncbi:radical SAM family heme chaperone HemW [Candidatus Schmidhempelia bombi]|uniref:Heme chaperone HemW n=1 Tax=Candidatus Schmidhempelia bombi str. Bimp TaxID=1387197 RepID=A0AB94IEJ7_9GAMM|nr:radical SAM family heme chaperone HemW [Candidatus Schmidhempelia bombi]TEA27915.1 radical SAM family heme chaperone HemW [Candidatus Schmidhempelia bombi str. Bimp]
MHNHLLPLSLYVHIPWCVQKCPYCDFNSHKLKSRPDYDAYIDHLLKDLQQDIALAGDRQISTIFIGGGTPSILEPNFIDKLIKGIRQRISVAADAEITMEANPNTVDALRFAGYQQAGVNRFSIGIQSFSDQKLHSLGRVHNTQEAKQAGQLANSLHLRSFNLDLMHGLPNQSLTEALFDLQQAIDLAPPHLSWYQLTIEPNTLFGSKPPILPDDDLLWEIYQQGHQLLVNAGYQQYETSAYAKVGYQCQHNLNYWRFGDYLGIGCGAHGKLTQANGEIIRTVKTRHPQGYMSGRYQEKRYNVPLADRPFEFFMNRFRLFEPTPKTEFTARTFLPFTSIENQIQQAMEQGYLSEDNDSWILTERGKLFLNELLALFLE